MSKKRQPNPASASKAKRKPTPKPKPAPMPKLTPAQKTQKQLDKIPGFCLFDDVFMNQVFDGNPPAAQLLVNIVLGRTDLRVVKVIVQRILPNLHGRGIRLDIFCEDSDGKLYDIEVQNPSEGAHPKRARYYSAIIDTNVALIGDEYQNLPETYVIFITREDYFGKGASLYKIDRTVADYNMPFEDEAHIIYVNGAYTGNDDVGKLMHDFHCTNARDMNYKELAEPVQYLKETKEGREKMCKVMQDLMDDSYNEGCYDTLVSEKIRAIKKAMRKYNRTFEEAYEDAEVDDVIAPAVLEAFGRKPV